MGKTFQTFLANLPVIIGTGLMMLGAVTGGYFVAGHALIRVTQYVARTFGAPDLADSLDARGVNVFLFVASVVLALGTLVRWVNEKPKSLK